MTGGKGPAGSNDASMRNLSDAIFANRRIVLPGWELLIEVSQRSNVARHRLGEPAGDQIPVMLHEDERHRGLEQHHRDDHDQERTIVEALRQHLRQPARRAPPKHADLRQLPELVE